MLYSILLIAAVAQSSRGQVLQPQRTEKRVPDRAQVGDVKSEGMLGGVTAGVVGSVQQSYTLPTLVRGPLLEEFKGRFTTGARLLRSLERQDLTDAEYEQLFKATDDWLDGNFKWLAERVSPWAAERFAFRTGTSFMWLLPGRSPQITDSRSNCINALQDMLKNFDQLMREPSIYSEPGK